MGFFGSLIGKGLGYLGEKAFGKTSGVDGVDLGGKLGERFLPFKKGGRVRKTGAKVRKAKKTKSRRKK